MRFYKPYEDVPVKYLHEFLCSKNLVDCYKITIYREECEFYEPYKSVWYVADYSNLTKNQFISMICDHVAEFLPPTRHVDVVFE